MSSNRDNYNSSVKSASSSKTATQTANETAKQTTIDGAFSVVGYTLQTGSYATLAAAVKAAVAAKVAADTLAEQTKQAAVGLARDTLRGTGDLAPV